GGRSPLGKARSLTSRLGELRRWARGRSFDHALAHGSHELTLTAPPPRGPPRVGAGAQLRPRARARLARADVDGPPPRDPELDDVRLRVRVAATPARLPRRHAGRSEERRVGKEGRI